MGERRGRKAAPILGLLLLTLAYGAFLAFGPRVVAFEMLVLEYGKPVPAQVYLFAVHPDRFRFLRGARADYGLARLTIDLTPMERAWRDEEARGRSAAPTFVVVAVADSGSWGFAVYNTEWASLIPTSTHRINVVVRPHNCTTGGAVAAKPRRGNSSPHTTPGAPSTWVPTPLTQPIAPSNGEGRLC